MSNFYNQFEERKSRNSYVCDYCAEGIPRGTKYIYQTGVMDLKWFTSRMHPKCFEEFCELYDKSLTPYSHPWPPDE